MYTHTARYTLFARHSPEGRSVWGDGRPERRGGLLPRPGAGREGAGNSEGGGVYKREGRWLAQTQRHADERGPSIQGKKWLLVWEKWTK